MMIRDATLSLAPSGERRFNGHAYFNAARARLCGWYAVYRQRRALLRLDDAVLKDIGVSRAEALEEGNKPFWRS